MTKSEDKKLLKMWGIKARERARGQCEVCGSSGILNVHHYIGRRNRATRWWIPNAVVLCYTHHKGGVQSAHEHPEWFREVMKRLRGDKWLKDLIKRSNVIFKGTYKEMETHINDS